MIIYHLKENFGLLGSGERCWDTTWTWYYTHSEELQCVKWLLGEDTCTSFPWDFGRASFQALPNQTWPCALLLWWVLALYTTKNLENLPKHFNRTEWQKLSQRVSFAIFFLQLENKNINHWQYVLYFCDMAIKLYYVVCIILSDF